MPLPAEPPESDTAAEKKRLRSALLARRADAWRADPEAGRHLAAAVAALPLPERATVAGYWPLRDEIDPRPAMLALLGLGHRLCLPVVVGPARPLAFRAWAPEARLETGGFGTQAPGPEAEERVPQVLLVPLVGFDAAGYRLGYGGGFYDRTLERLRRDGATLAVGLAFAAQAVERLPRESTDQPLDWLVTEAGTQRFGRAAASAGRH